MTLKRSLLCPFLLLWQLKGPIKTRGEIEYEKDHTSFVFTGSGHDRSGSRHDERDERLRRQFLFHRGLRQHGSVQRSRSRCGSEQDQGYHPHGSLAGGFQLRCAQDHHPDRTSGVCRYRVGKAGHPERQLRGDPGAVFQLRDERRCLHLHLPSAGGGQVPRRQHPEC